jgi:hypothetical protein
VFQRESCHPHKVQLHAPARRFPISCLYFASPSFSRLARNSFHCRPLAISHPSGQCGTNTSNSYTFPDNPQHAGMQVDAYSQGLWLTRLQGTLLGSRWMSIAPRGSTTETARRNHPLLPLAPPPTTFPSMTGLAPPSNMFVTPPPPRSSSHSSSSSDIGSSTLFLLNRPMR